jgi:hypothetical protein
MLTYRAYYGWITDVASRARYGPWPATGLDASLLADYETSFALQRRLGLDVAVIWGLFVSREWPADLPARPDAGAAQPETEREAGVRRLLDAAHRHGIRVLAGLGVYSWGFEAIIRAHPELSAGNPRALCASVPEAWDWQRRVIDRTLTRAEVDGVGLQSADQGRCPCPRCARWGDLEYHARLTARVTAYVKERWPGKLVNVNTWGVSTEDPADLPHLVEMARGADYLVDVFGGVARRDPGYRRRVVAALDGIGVAYGTNGGISVRPPQHWQRYRWFIPTLREPARHLAGLAADGGRAAELFDRVQANSGDGVSLCVHAHLLRAPTRPVEAILEEVLGELYRPRSATAGADLVALFLEAERAFLARWRSPLPGAPIYLERLGGDRPGEPQYLTRHMAPEALSGYERELLALREAADRLVPEVGAGEKLRLVDHCLDGMLGDVAHAIRASEGASPA